MLNNLKDSFFCINCIADVLEERGLKPMQRMLNATGGWPITMSEKELYAQNYTWQKMDNDYFQLYNFFILFDISYLNDNENHGIFMVYIYCYLRYICTYMFLCAYMDMCVCVILILLVTMARL